MGYNITLCTSKGEPKPIDLSAEVNGWTPSDTLPAEIEISAYLKGMGMT